RSPLGSSIPSCFVPEHAISSMRSYHAIQHASIPCQAGGGTGRRALAWHACLEPNAGDAPGNHDEGCLVRLHTARTARASPCPFPPAPLPPRRAAAPRHDLACAILRRLVPPAPPRRAAVVRAHGAPSRTRSCGAAASL